MHMSDALVSPVVGGAFCAVAAGLIAYSSRRVHDDMDRARIPLMGVLGAFVFAAQMINFTIPGTGSSGHLGGGMLLVILLGPHAAFIVISSVLLVQALLFADGGLLALGCNIFNLGLLPCFVAYPLVYRPVGGSRPKDARLMAAVVAGSVAALQLGALGVVSQTWLSGISELPFRTFLLLMQPIHLAIGVVEGVVTAAVVSFVWKARPEVLDMERSVDYPLKKVLAGFLFSSLLLGGGLSLFASEYPDGLEWAVYRTSGQEELEAVDGTVHRSCSRIQSEAALLADYSYAAEDSVSDAGTPVAGLVGSGVTLLSTVLAGGMLKRRKTVR